MRKPNCAAAYEMTYMKRYLNGICKTNLPVHS